jgi:hypothetical protein
MSADKNFYLKAFQMLKESRVMEIDKIEAPEQGM